MRRSIPFLSSFLILSIALAPASAKIVDTKTEKMTFDRCVTLVRGKVARAEQQSRLVHGNLEVYAVDFISSDATQRISCIKKSSVMVTVDTDYMIQ